MGIHGSCIKRQASLPEERPTRKVTASKSPNRQYPLTPPVDISNNDDSLDLQQLEIMLNQSLHKTASFGSQVRSTQQNNPTGQSNPVQSPQPLSIIQLINQHISEEHASQQQPSRQSSPSPTPLSQLQLKKESQFKPGAMKQLSRSLSSNEQRKPVALSVQDDSKSIKQKDSDTQTMKSILKNKNYKRGQSLRAVKPTTTEDSQSVKTLKSQNKKVSFDPKIFRPKNRNGFM